MEEVKRSNFNNPNKIIQSWYLICKSSEVKKGKAISKLIFGKRFVIWRGSDNKINVMNEKCAHMGAMLSKGDVVDNCIRCPFHHWQYDSEGKCSSIPYIDEIPKNAKVNVYPSEERYGVIWFFYGPKVLFPLPFIEGETNKPIKLQSRKNTVHPHVMMPNSLDIPHWEYVHGIKIKKLKELDLDDKWRMGIEMEGVLVDNPETISQKILKFLGLGHFKWKMTSWGGNVATVELFSPMKHNFIIAYTPTPEGHNEIQTLAFFTKRNLFFRLTGINFILCIINAILISLIFFDDLKVIRTIDFQTNFTKEDRLVAKFIRHINSLETFNS